ncbi:hypothetical protein [Spiroplasma endosymbiont of Villa modesta]
MNNKNINEKIKIIMKTKITNNEEKKENQKTYSVIIFLKNQVIILKFIL